MRVSQLALPVGLKDSALLETFAAAGNEQIVSALRDLEAAARPATGSAPRHSDYDLNLPLAPEPDTLKAAAVLVPLIQRDGLQVLLTRRTQHLRHHAGQVSFPGGRVETDDDSPLAAALRESEEEIGLPPERVQPLGLLDDYETVTGFLVTPVVALVEPDVRLRLDSFEVSEAFEVPLSFVLDPSNHQVHARERNGVLRRYFVFEYQHHYIWGATAGMLMNFYRRLNGLSATMRPNLPTQQPHRQPETP